MSKKSFSEFNCAVAQTLEIVGEWWTFLIIRNAFCGMKSFGEFQSHLGVPTNILAARLRKLTDAGILTRRRGKKDKRVLEYRLTEKGLELYPILVAMTQWGEKWLPNPLGARVRLVETSSREEVATVRVHSKEGRPLRPQEVQVQAGPAADDKIRELISSQKSLSGA